MLHIWILKLGLNLAYYLITLGHPIAYTYNVMKKKQKRDYTWPLVITYWVVYALLFWLDCLLFFVSEYDCAIVSR